jgi:hypothetical protein
MPSKINPGVLANGKLFSNRALTRRQLENDLNAGLQNVKNYSDSTVGDGTTDARAAIAAADTAGPVVLPPGTYAVASNLTLTKKITFLPGAKLKPASGVTVTLSDGYVANEDQHVFDISDAGVIVLTKKVPVYAEHWGAKADGTTNSTDAVQAAINATKNVRFLPGQYICTVTCDPDNGSVLLEGNNTLLTAVNSNEFALTLTGEYANGVCRISNITFYGDNPAHGAVPGRTKHGLLVNIASNLFLDNCWFSFCDLGLVTQLTIITTYSALVFNQCRVGAYYTARTTSTGTLSVTTPRGVVYVLPNPVHGVGHPAEALLVGARFTLCDIGFVVDSPGNEWAPSRDFKIDKPLFQYCKVGMLLLPEAGGWSDHPVIINTPWFEGQDVGTSVDLNGVTYAGCDVHNDGVQAIQYGGWISSIRGRSAGNYRLENASWTTSGDSDFDLLDLQDQSSVTGEIVYAVGRVPFPIRAGVPLRASLGPLFTCAPMISKGYQRRDSAKLLFAKSCEADDLPSTFFGGTSLGVINDGPADVNESLGYLATAGNGVTLQFTGEADSLYVSKFAVKAYCPVRTFTVNAGTDVFTSEGHDFANNMEVRLFTTTTLPAGSALATSYYVIDADTGEGTFKLSATVGGASINVTDTGTGTHTVQQITSFDLRTNPVDAGAFIGAVALPTTNTWQTWCINGLTPSSVTDSSFFIGGATATVVRAFLIAQMYVAKVENFGEALELIDSQQFFSKLPYTAPVVDTVLSTYDSDIELTVASADGYLESDTFISHALSGDFEVEFQLKSLSIGAVFGVQTSATPAVSHNYESPLFGVQCPNAGTVRVWKSGVLNDHAATWSNGKVRIVRSGTTISLFVDNVEIVAAETTGATTADIYPVVTFSNASIPSVFLRSVDGTVSHVGDNVSISKIKNSTGYQNVLDYSHSIIGVSDGITDARGVIATADAAGPIVLPPGTYAIASNITLTNKVTFVPGAKLKPASGVVVTLTEGFHATDDQHVFDISSGGSFVISNKQQVYPEQFGAIGDDSTDDSAAIQAAINSGANIVEFQAKTYRCNVTIPTRITIRGASNTGTILKPANEAVAIFNQTASAPYWTYASRYERLRFQGRTAKTGIGFTFGKTTPSDWVNLDEYANNAVFDGCVFIGLNKGVQHPFGNIGTTFYNCGWQSNKYGVYNLDSKFGTWPLGIMHGGNKYWYEGEFSGNEIAVYFDGQAYGIAGVVFNNTLFQSNQVLIYGNTGTAAGTIKFNNIWVEGNGVNYQGIETATNIDEWTGTSVTPASHNNRTFILKGANWNIVANGGGPFGDIQMPATYSQFLIEDASAERSEDGQGGTCTVDGTSTVVQKRVTTTTGTLLDANCVSDAPVMLSKLFENNNTRAAARYFLTGLGSVTYNVNSVVSKNFDTLQTMQNVSGFTSELVTDDDCLFGVCNQYSKTNFLTSDFSFISGTGVASTDDAWYTVTLNVKRVSGSFYISVFDLFSTGKQVFANIQIAEAGKWFRVCSIIKTPSTETFDLWFHGLNADCVFRLGGYQVNKFDTEEECISFLNKGEFYTSLLPSPKDKIEVIASSSTPVFDFSNNNGDTKTNILTSDITPTITVDRPGTYQLVFTQNATGNYEIFWPANVIWRNSPWQPSQEPLSKSHIDLVSDGTNFFADGIEDNNDYQLELDGVDDYATIPNITFPNAGTLMIRLKLDNATGAVSKNGLMELGAGYGAGIDGTYYPLYLNELAYTSIFRATRVDAFALSGSITRTNWHWVIIRSDVANNWQQLQATDAGVLYSNQTATHETIGTIPGYIGRGGGGGGYLDGKIDRVLIFNSRLSDANIQAAIATRPDENLPSGCLARYEFGLDRASKLLRDTSGNGNHATIVNGSIGMFIDSGINNILEDLGTLGSGTEVFNFNNGYGVAKTIEATGDIALQFVATVPGNYVAIVEMDGTGGHTVTYATTVVGTAPTMNTAANAKTLIPLFYDGTTWFHA